MCGEGGKGERFGGRAEEGFPGLALGLKSVPGAMSLWI